MRWTCGSVTNSGQAAVRTGLPCGGDPVLLREEDGVAASPVGRDAVRDAAALRRLWSPDRRNIRRYLAAKEVPALIPRRTQVWMIYMKCEYLVDDTLTWLDRAKN